MQKETPNGWNSQAKDMASEPVISCDLSLPEEIQELRKIAEKHGVILLEDAVQAHGTRYQGKRTGSIGHGSGFSFYPAKNLGAWGDGGALVTSDHELARKVKRIRNYGQKEKYVHFEQGWNEKRRQIAESYYEQLVDAPAVLTFQDHDGNEAVHHLFVVQMTKRYKVQRNLQARGVQTGIHYPISIHKHECFWSEGFARGKTFPHAEKQAADLLSLPMHPKLTKEEVILITDLLKECLNK
jgi:dTDP-4-amino-4,6-dideoxygalactose transaminase